MIILLLTIVHYLSLMLPLYVRQYYVNSLQSPNIHVTLITRDKYRDDDSLRMPGMRATSHLGTQGFIGGRAACCNLESASCEPSRQASENSRSLRTPYGHLTADLERHQYCCFFSACNQASSDYLERHYALFCITSTMSLRRPHRIKPLAHRHHTVLHVQLLNGLTTPVYPLRHNRIQTSNMEYEHRR